MTIYSLYIFDRHCDCVYYQDWHRTRPIRPPPPSSFKPGVHRIPSVPHPSDNVRPSIFDENHNPRADGVSVQDRLGGGSGRAPKGLPFDEESKLVYGVLISLRSMVKRLSGRDEAFTSYSTPQYKLHLFESPTGYKFVLLSDPSSDDLRFVLRQLYVGPFLEYVVRNPLVKMDSREEGIDNDLFRGAVDRHMRGLTMFGS
ncbi:hypothetical protein L202_02844 [Cryptococcus amylolentus CBS 6039]|uniref:Trafficking protein particle complex subunit n=2 Tax=Cryptococcus amylolentus TaxID=104669 RepID=A0A1E3HWK3_9TREE|nr:hypothetical protein L202_02844 [Cryptococcus amylolentus CBS 6039]ODN80667.1 hypothetical protein L202_02844 [Cryptococcus amylolentus CBS 6039]ODO09220.1 hypothetical protein I350_02820 [Cryptococcus amylolentus CBS 6273]